MELTVVLAVYNEAENLPILWEELAAALDRLGRRAEVLFVDDASTDGGPDFLRTLAARDARVRVLRFARNAGLTAVLLAGMRAATGQVIVTMDSDLQNDPADIAGLLRHLDGFDAAVGWRRRRRDPWIKRLSSRIANRVRTAVLGDAVRDSACTLRAMRRECREAMVPYQGMHRFVPTLLRHAGFRVVEVEVNHRPRRHGRSKYGVRNRAFRAFADLLAVRWLISRRISYTIVEEIHGPAAGVPAPGISDPVRTAARPPSARP